MNSLSSMSAFNPSEHFRSAEVYTDLNSLQALKNIEDKEQALRKVSQQFESIFIGLMIKSMRDANAVFEEGSLFSSNETKFYRDMYDQQLALSVSHSGPGGIGIAEAMYRQLSSDTEVEKSTLNTGLNTLSQPVSKTLHPKAPRTNMQSTENHTTNASDVVGNSGARGNVERAPLAGSPEQFLNMLDKPLEQAAKVLGVDKNILLAQAALETGWGKHVLQDGSSSSNNLFNIKAGSNWQGESVSVSSLEFRDGTFKPEISSFRSYSSLEESVSDYVKFVQENPRYKKALENASDSAMYIRSLHQAGYATDPNYADKVLKLQQRIGEQLAEADSAGRRG
ncbi:flagellar protein FlgJ [Alteromonadaceae bacterium Bs31]|nr:flagellar protein FlgJ [Alteromonadaceae bacterium Bs31]